MDRVIMKKALWRYFSWWWRYDKEHTRRVLGMLTIAYPGVVFSCRGLKIPSGHLQGETGPRVSYEATARDLQEEDENDEPLDDEPSVDPDGPLDFDGPFDQAAAGGVDGVGG
ncbi:MAG: hypothetical protein HY556_02105 [Euryarchaeota archaeon]|nr:hypothetical protein [Euryarchaeota archaeon]